MAGQICPKCKKATFFKNSTGRECSKCGFTMVIPANSGKGGKGSLCPNCLKFTVFNGVCRNPKCGAKFK